MFGSLFKWRIVTLKIILDLNEKESHIFYVRSPLTLTSVPVHFSSFHSKAIWGICFKYGCNIIPVSTPLCCELVLAFPPSFENVVTIANRVLRHCTEASGAPEQSYVTVCLVPGKLAFEVLDHRRKRPTLPRWPHREATYQFQLRVKSSSHSSPDARHVCKQAF